MPLYANITTATQGNKDGGFKPTLYISRVADISTWQYPSAAGAVLGDATEITVAHTWAASKGAYTWETKLGSVTLTQESAGDEGAKVQVWTARCRVLGLDKATIEQMKNSLNDQLVIFLKDSNCLAANNFFQLGDECNPCTVETTHDSKDSLPTSTGQKEWEVIFRCKKLYTYNAAVDTTF